MTLSYNGIPPFLPRQGSLFIFFPLYICREEHQVKSLMCSHSCDLNKMNRSAVLTHLPRRRTAEENSSQTPFYLNCLTFILTTLATDHKENQCTYMYVVYIHFCGFVFFPQCSECFQGFCILHFFPLLFLISYLFSHHALSWLTNACILLSVPNIAHSQPIPWCGFVCFSYPSTPHHTPDHLLRC